MTIRADYLVVGAGAMGMAFVDTLLSDSDATVVLVERRGRPGGHWNDAYPFVRLHQPSAFYGVDSQPLGSDTKDATGWNQGLYELASGHEVCAYFDRVLNQRFLPSGRVNFFPSAEYEGGRRFRSLLSGRVHEVDGACQIVDATYMNVAVPAIRPPEYEVAPSVRCVPVNGLTSVATVPDRYVIVGAGKTGMDACLWLLANDVDPGAITWIMPRDSWIIDRANIQPGPEFLPAVVGSVARQMEVSAEASTLDELFAGLEEEGVLLRIDPAVRPTMYRCATVTRAELDQLRRIGDVARSGRVKRIDETEIVLDGGTIPTGPNALHVDCSADGLATRPAVPIFAEEKLTLQSVRTCQQVFSAALIAHVETAYDDPDRKNELCTVVPHPDTDIDWLRTTIQNTLNNIAWRMDPDLTAWLTASRLDPFTRARQPTEDGGADEGHGEVRSLTRRLLAATGPAVENLQRLLAEHERTGSGP